MAKRIQMVCERQGKTMFCHPPSRKIRRTRKRRRPKSRKYSARVRRSCAKRIPRVGKRLGCYKYLALARSKTRKVKGKYKKRRVLKCKTKSNRIRYCVYGRVR